MAALLRIWCSWRLCLGGIAPPTKQFLHDHVFAKEAVGTKPRT